MKRNDLQRKHAMYHLLTQWDKSEMNQKEFCQKHGINYSVFKYWNKKRKLELENKGSKRSECSKKLSFKKTESFIPITLKQKLQSTGIHITYPNGVEVACPEEMEFEQFKLLVQIY